MNLQVLDKPSSICVKMLRQESIINNFNMPALRRAVGYQPQFGFVHWDRVKSPVFLGMT